MATRDQTWLPEAALDMSRQFLSMMLELATIVAYLHDECVVHHDLKPDNTMVRYGSNELVLLDMGLSCFQPGCVPLTRPEDEIYMRFACHPNRGATHGYIPHADRYGTVPEREDEENETDNYRKFDVYSLGKVFCDLTIGRMAYRELADFQEHVNHMEPNEAVQRHYNTGNEDLNTIVRDMLFVPVIERPTIRRVIERLRNVQVDRPFTIFRV
jgi:serine/threonine protein kinase